MTIISQKVRWQKIRKGTKFDAKVIGPWWKGGVCVTLCLANWKRYKQFKVIDIRCLREETRRMITQIHTWWLHINLEYMHHTRNKIRKIT